MRTIVVLLLLVFHSPVAAEDITFYEKETDKFWAVFGTADTETGQATCYGRANKKDGSFIQIHRSLVDGELWAIIRNTAWEIETEGRGVLRWNFYRSGKDAFIDGTEFTYEIRNKNTILILEIAPKRFTEVSSGILVTSRWLCPVTYKTCRPVSSARGHQCSTRSRNASVRTKLSIGTLDPLPRKSRTPSEARYEIWLDRRSPSPAG